MTSSNFIPENNKKLADKLLEKACIRLNFDPKAITKSLNKQLLHTVIIKHVYNLTDRPEEHTMMAGAIAMWNNYKNSPTNVREYLEIFRPYLRRDVGDFLEKHADALQKEILFENDFKVSYFSAGTLIGTYLARVKYGEDPKEIPQFTWLRVAVGKFCQRKTHGGIDAYQWVLRMYKRLSNKDGIFGTPVLLNIGFIKGAPASCIIMTIEDDMEDILDVIKEGCMASKNNAGIGCDFSGLRHSNIGRHGKSQGIVPLLKVWDDLTKYVNQGGVRDGALTASVRVHHSDAPETISLVDKTAEVSRQLTRVDVSIMLSDIFMERIQTNGKWTLFCPKQTGNLNLLHGKAFSKKYIEYEKKSQEWHRYKKYTFLAKLEKENNLDIESVDIYKTLEKEFKNKEAPEEIDSRVFNARDILRHACTLQCTYSKPYIIHGCNVNRKNNMDNVGPVRSSNLCQEIMIPAVPKEQTGCCNLASISLKKFASHKGFDYIGFSDAVRDFIVGLNQVVDNTINVSNKVKKSNDDNRPIGLGVTGFGNMMHILDIPFVDINKLPKKVVKDGKTTYINVDIAKESPSYDDESLKERVVNPKAMDLVWRIWSCMYYNALLSSMKEAKAFGPYKNFSTSHTAKGELQYHLWKAEEKETGRTYPFKLDPCEPKEWGQEGSWSWLIEQIKKHGLRNALLLTCMPSASTAQVLDNTETTETYSQIIGTRKVMSGEYPVINYHTVKDLQELNLWNEKTYNNIVANDGSILGLSESGLSKDVVTKLRFLKEKYLNMWEIPQKAIIQLAAQRQVFIDHSQSTNLYIKHPTPDMMMGIHLYTWKMGLKTGMYYLRTRSSSQVMRIGTVEKDKALDKLEKEIDDTLYDDNSNKKKIKEEYDPDLIRLKNLVHAHQEEFRRKEEIVRDKVIAKALKTASSPSLVCSLDGSSECVSCQ